jgi:hypothetical protein
MWWCCGKRDLNAPGCQYQKHSTKTEEQREEKEKEDDNTHKQVKCMCCKEYGHSADQCPRDPNYRSGFNVLEEDGRVENKKDAKKLNSDA